MPLAVLSLTGPENVTQVATIAWGKALGEWAFFTANLFALAAMMTSYWAVAGSFLTNIVDKFNFKSEDDVKTRLFVLACVVIPPFILAYSGLVALSTLFIWLVRSAVSLCPCFLFDAAFGKENR